MSYRKIDPSMWDDERFAPLTRDAKLTWICILTGPHTTPLPGLFVCGVATLAESMRCDTDTVSHAVSELSGKGLVRFNQTTRVMQVPNAPKYNPCANPKVLKGWFTVWKGVPDCAEKYDHIERLHAAISADKEAWKSWASATWCATFGTVEKPSRYGIGNSSDTVSNSGSGSSSGSSTGAGGGVGEHDRDASTVEGSPKASPPAGAASGATDEPSAQDIAATVARLAAEEAARIIDEQRKADEARERAAAEARRAKRAAKKAAAAAKPDKIPLPGTLARKIYDAIVSDAALAPITANPGEAAMKWADPDAFPGVDVLAQVHRAAEYLTSRGEPYTDGRAYLRNWLKREADRVARAPRPAVTAAPRDATKPAPRPAHITVAVAPPPLTPEQEAEIERNRERGRAVLAEIQARAAAAAKGGAS